MIRLEKLNNLKVTPIRIKKDNRPVKGQCILGDSPYINIMQVAPTFGGKTTATFNILKQCVQPGQTKIIAFVPSIYNDENWIAIREYFEDLGNELTIYTSLKNEQGKDLLKEYVKDFTEEATIKDSQRKKKKEKSKNKNKYKTDKNRLIYFGDSDSESDDDNIDVKKKNKCKYAEYIFIFDDISDELRSKNYETLMKYARHFCILTISSSQDAKDINPATIKQMRIWMLFKNIDDERLYHIYNKLGLRISYDLFKKYYDYATKDYYDENDKELKNHNFLYFAPRLLQFRRNFNYIFSDPL